MSIFDDPENEEYDEMIEWSGDYDPEEFNSKNVIFDDQNERLKKEMNNIEYLIDLYDMIIALKQGIMKMLNYPNLKLQVVLYLESSHYLRLKI